MTHREKIRFLALHTIGNFLLLFSLYGVVMTFGPALLSETTFRIAQIRGIRYTVAEQNAITPVSLRSQAGSPASRAPLQNDDYLLARGPTLGSVLAGKKEQIIIPKDTQFSIVIPKIGASAKVFPNIDPENEKEFLKVLQHGIAHARGSVFPGFEGTSYLFAHSTDTWWRVGRYNAIFYLLKDLNPTDQIIVFFENQRYDYIVSERFIAPASDVSALLNSHTGEERLVLQTCWPPGTTLQRLFVVATPKKS